MSFPGAIQKFIEYRVSSRWDYRPDAAECEVLSAEHEHAAALKHRIEDAQRVAKANNLPPVGKTYRRSSVMYFLLVLCLTPSLMMMAVFASADRSADVLGIVSLLCILCALCVAVQIPTVARCHAELDPTARWAPILFLLVVVSLCRLNDFNGADFAPECVIAILFFGVVLNFTVALVFVSQFDITREAFRPNNSYDGEVAAQCNAWLSRLEPANEIRQAERNLDLALSVFVAFLASGASFLSLLGETSPYLLVFCGVLAASEIIFLVQLERWRAVANVYPPTRSSGALIILISSWVATVLGADFFLAHSGSSVGEGFRLWVKIGVVGAAAVLPLVAERGYKLGATPLVGATRFGVAINSKPFLIADQVTSTVGVGEGLGLRLQRRYRFPVNVVDGSGDEIIWESVWKSKFGSRKWKYSHSILIENNYFYIFGIERRYRRNAICLLVRLRRSVKNGDRRPRESRYRVSAEAEGASKPTIESYQIYSCNVPPLVLHGSIAARMGLQPCESAHSLKIREDGDSAVLLPNRS